jgi:hypothetical protein
MHSPNLLDSLQAADNTPPGVYRVFYGSRDRLDELAVDLDIWEVRPESGYAVVALSAEDAAHLKSQGYHLELAMEKMQQLMMGPPGYSCYSDVEDLYSIIQEIAVSYPGLTELVDYGDSWRKVQGLSGYDLWVLRITNSQVSLPKPRFFLMANIHARELTTPETALYFVDYLLGNYGTDPDVTWILDYHEIHVVLTANPDGRQLVEGGCYQRKNRNDTLGSCNLCETSPYWGNQFGVDLNRNNPYHWGGAGVDPCGTTYQGTAAASEPETYYLNDYVRSIIPDQRANDDLARAPDHTTGLLISLHSYGNLVLWPWGWTSGDAPNELQLQTLGRKFSYFNNYTNDQLYSTTGDTTD